MQDEEKNLPENKEINLPENKEEALPENPSGNLPEKAADNGNKTGRKLNWNKKYTTIAIYALLVILFAVVCAFFFLNYNDFGTYVSGITSVFKPIIYGGIFSYMLNYLMKFFERTVFRKTIDAGHVRAGRLLSVLLTAVILLIFISLIILMIVPQVISGYNDLESKISFYIANVQEWLRGLSVREGLFASYIKSIVDYINGLIDNIYELIKNTLPAITTALGTIVITVKDVLLGLVFAVYFLIAKERLLAQMKKLIRAISGEKAYPKIREIFRICDDKFGKYFIIRLVDMITIGTVSFFGFWAIGIPYYPLISFIVGFSSFIPIFGPIVGIALSGFIIFISSTDVWKLIGFLIFIIAVMIIEKQLVRRFLRRNDIGLSAIWIFFAIIVMTGFFGLAGTILGVPIFAIVYDLIKVWTERRLKKKGVPHETLSEEYLYHAEQIKEDAAAAAEIADARRKKTAAFFSDVWTRISAWLKTVFEKIKALFSKESRGKKR